LAENPEKAFSCNGNQYKDQARIAELERLLGQAHAEIDLLKKAFAMTQKKVREERMKPMLRDGT
jgi:transposase